MRQMAFERRRCQSKDNDFAILFGFCIRLGGRRLVLSRRSHICGFAMRVFDVLGIGFLDGRSKVVKAVDDGGWNCLH